MQISKKWFEGDAVDIAKKLLGKKIEFKNCSGIIVETEAYKTDEASHGFKLTPRSQIMADSYGNVYVYFIYGNYFCLNFTTNKNDVGAVLIRAIEPLEGINTMKKRRKQDNIHNLCSGPGKLCQAFNITKQQNNKDVGEEIIISTHKNIKDSDIIKTKRIGISKATHLDWRFYIKNNNFVS